MTDREYLEFLNSLDENLVFYEKFDFQFNNLEKYKNLKRIYWKF